MKIFKIAALSLTLIASVFLLNNTTRAAVANVNLQITGTPGTCVIGNTSSLGSTAFSYANQSLNGPFTGTTAPGGVTWRCFDSNGVAAWNLALVINGNLVNQSNAALTIPMTGVSYANFAVHQQAGSGTCTSVTWASTSPTDWKTINGSQKVLEKTSQVGQVCRVQTTGLFLKVDIPGGTNVGIYSGTMTITLPTF